MKTILITGGCGFIASHFSEHVHKNTDWNILILDKLTYASRGMARLRDSGILSSPRVRVYTTDISQPLTSGMIQELGVVDYIIHMAAETHVDNSIKYPAEIIQNNVMGTTYILEYARKLPNLEKFFYFSTDEVYGSAPEGVFYKEDSRHNPTNPYSASKSAGEQICIAYRNTYKIPIIMVNVMNAFGERQHVEKFIPKCIKSILKGEKIFIHCGPDNDPGSRFYIHARNISAAVLFLIHNGAIGELYHIMGEKEVNNLEMAQFIAREMGKPLDFELVNYHADRPGHDLRYALDSSKIESIGWKEPIDFDNSLRKTITWTLANQTWLES